MRPRHRPHPERRRRWRRALLPLVVLMGLSGLLAARAIAVQADGPVAQADGPAIVIDWPNEGETLYAGPSSLLYSVPLSGHVTPAQGDLVVELTITQDGAPAELLQTRTAADGTYTFLVTVNPSGSDGRFPAEHLTCGDDCHLPGNADLPAGALTLRVSLPAFAESARSVATRHIGVDRSTLATLSVRLVRGDDPKTAVAGVQVSAATWLYMWRARHITGLSDATGLAVLRAEALSLAPTDYVLTVVPTIVDGVLYVGQGAVSISLPAGGGAAEPVEILVSAHVGSIKGSVQSHGPALPDALPISALRLPAGERVATVTAQAGSFALAPLPLDRLLILVDPTTLAQAGLYSRPEAVDLRQIVETEVTLPLFAAGGVALEGTIRDAESGHSLPFAWLSCPAAREPGRANPADGRFRLESLTEPTASILATAPGYYSLAAVAEQAGQTPPLALALKRRPDTAMYPWGAGQIVIPGGSESTDSAGPFRLERGYLWGYGGDSPSTILVGRTVIDVGGGDFAIEMVPGQRGWFYQFSGAATLRRVDSPEPIQVGAGQMVNLLNPDGYVPVAYDAAVIRALAQPGTAIPDPIWEPTLSARVRDGLARIGVSTAKALTLVTYTLALLSLLGGPALLLWRWRRHPAQPHPS